jgi:DNA polymerase-3 subunit gamma/tau
LKSALERNRLAHAYLFAGPRGVGKTSTARILAKALNCKDGPTLKPCQKCTSCMEISQSRSFDVIEIDGASNRGIEEIRVLRENVKFTPATGKFKVYIIDEVHMLTLEAFNALLKTLEEPPAFVKFIFATTQPQKVPPTILSRCQRLDFRRISLIEITAQLEKIVAQEKIDVDKDALLAIAKASDGSLRDAESLLDQILSYCADKVSLRDTITVLGIVEQEALFAITDKIIQKDAKSALELLNNIIDEGKDVSLFLANFIEHFRNLMIAKVTKADARLIDLPQDTCNRLLGQAQLFSLEEILTAFNTLTNAQEMSKRLDSLRTPLEISLVKLAHDKRGSSLDQPNKGGTHLQRRSIPNPPPANLIKEETGEFKEAKEDKHIEPVDCKQEARTSLALDNIKSIWEKIIETIGRVKMSLATYLSEGTPLKLENNILTVSFPKNYSLHKETLEKKENKIIIEKIISELFNANLKIDFTLSKEIIQDDDKQSSPFLKSALEAFRARVIKE